MPVGMLLRGSKISFAEYASAVAFTVYYRAVNPAGLQMKPIHYLIAFITLNHTALAAARVAVPLYAIHLQASPAVVGIIAGLFAIVPTLASVPIGRLVDRIGTRPPFVVCQVLMICGAVLPFFWADSVPVLYLTALLFGGAYFALFIVNTALGGYYGKPEERSSNFTQMSLGFAIANGAGPLLGGFAIDHSGFRQSFLLLAMPSLIAFALFLLGRLPQRGPAGAYGKTAAKRSVLDLWRNTRLRPIFMISIYFMLFWDIFLVMSPIYGAQLHMSASAIGTVIGTYSAASFIVRIFIAPLVRRFTPLQLLLMSQALGAIAMLAFGLSSTVALLIVCAFIMGAGQGVGGPMVTTAVYEASPPERVGEAIGVRMSVGMACQAFLPLLAGAAASAAGVAPIFWITALVLMFGVWQYRAQWHVDLRAQSKAQDKDKTVGPSAEVHRE